MCSADAGHGALYLDRQVREDGEEAAALAQLLADHARPALPQHRKGACMPAVDELSGHLPAGWAAADVCGKIDALITAAWTGLSSVVCTSLCGSALMQCVLRPGDMPALETLWTPDEEPQS